MHSQLTGSAMYCVKCVPIAITTHRIYSCCNPFNVFFLSLEIQKCSNTFTKCFLQKAVYTGDTPGFKWAKDTGWAKCFLETLLSNCISFSTIELFNQTFIIYMQILLVFC